MSAERIARARALLREHDVDALLIVDSANRRYLAGYRAEDDGPDESEGIILIDASHAELLCSPNNVGWAASEASGIDVGPWARPWAKSVADRATDRGWRRLGIEDETLTVAAANRIQRLSAELQLVPINDAVHRLRSCKDAAELATLQRAFAITDEVFTAVTSAIQPGVTEREVASRLEEGFRSAGAEGAGFPIIVASGPNAARPHHHSGDRPIGLSEAVIIDLGARVDGYTADLTRTVWFGDTLERLAEVYNSVLHAQSAAIAMIRAGVPARDVDRAAREAIEAAGFGHGIVHSVGHGVGLRIHEAPSVSLASDDVLQSGMVVTIEPGIYLSDWGGVRIEDVVVVTDEGYQVLTHAPKLLGAAEQTSGLRSQQE